MKKFCYMLFILVGFVALPSFSKDIACHGEIVFIMAEHSGCTDENGKRQLAFKTVSGSKPWMCTRSEIGGSLLLAAKVAKKSVQVYISDQGQGLTCQNIPDYSKVSYIILSE